MHPLSQSYIIEIAGLALPLYGWAFLALAIIICSFLLIPASPRRSWRVAASRRWLKHFRRNAHRFSPAQRFSFLRRTDHFLFEDILMSAFEERGYRVRRTPATGDGGSDGYVAMEGLRVVIQAKRYNGRISRAHVVALHSLARNTPRQDAGLFIHTGQTSSPIKRYVRQHADLDMISGSKDLLALLDGAPVQLFGRRIRPAPRFDASAHSTHSQALNTP
jgi:restriction system protein